MLIYTHKQIYVVDPCTSERIRNANPHPLIPYSQKSVYCYLFLKNKELINDSHNDRKLKQFE